MKTKYTGIKRLVYLVAVIILAININGCRGTLAIRKNPSGPVKSAPPGQMKKITGEKSAKRYAPGQQKKKKNKRKGHVVEVEIPYSNNN